MDIKNELAEIFYKIWTWLALIFVGMVGVVSNNLYTGRKMSTARIIGSLGLAFFVGVIASFICDAYGWEKSGKVIVPMATLLSDRIMLALFSIDWSKSFKQVMKEWLQSWANKIK